MRIAIAVLFTVLLSGCQVSTRERVTPVSEKYPVLDMPEKPRLEPITSADLAPLSDDIKKKLIFNNDAIQLYATRLAALAQQYNTFANWKNSGSTAAFGAEIVDLPKEE